MKHDSLGGVSSSVEFETLLRRREIGKAISYRAMDSTVVVDYLRNIFADFFYFWITCLVLLTTLIIIWILFKPYHIIRSPYIVGFGHLSDGFSSNRKISRKQMVFDIMKRRTRASDSYPVFPNGWIPILASKKLAIGKSIAVTVLGEDLALFRGTDGKAFVVDAYCPHLGANLGVGGKVTDTNCIQCPFHGWKFSGVDGSCVSIPYSEKALLTAKVRSWPTCEKTGFIFIWYHAEGEAPNWEIPEIEEIVNGEWNEKGTTEHTAFCHLQEIPENGADWAHFSQVHSESVMSGSDLRTKMGGIWAPVKHKWTPKWRSGDPPNGHMAFLELDTHISLFDVDLPLLDLALKIQQIGPALVYLRFSKPFLNGAYIQYVTPEAPYQHRITHAFYCNWKVPSIVGKYYLTMEAIQVERDIMIWNNKRFLKTPIIVKEDHLLAKYRRWFAQFYSANSPTLKDIEERRLDW